MENTNKKGQISAILIVAIAIGILMLVFGLGALFSTKLKFLIVGVGIIVLTFVYGVPAALTGNFTKNKKNFLLILFISGVLITAIPYVGLFQMSSTPGFYVNSISSNIPVTSNLGSLSGYWFYANVYTGGGQQINGEITPSSFKQLSGIQTKQSLLITADAVDETVKYSIQNTGDQIKSYKYSIQKSVDVCENPPYVQTADAPACPNPQSGDGATIEIDLKQRAKLYGALAGSGIFTGAGYYTCERWCINEYSIGTTGLLQANSVTDKVTLSVQAGNEKITNTVSVGQGADFTSNTLGDVVAHVDFPASGVTGNQIPNNVGLTGFYNKAINKWNLFDSNLLNTYSSAYATASSQLSGYASSNGRNAGTTYDGARTQILNTIKSVYTQTAQIIADNRQIDSSQFWNNQNSEGSASLNIILDRQINNPNLVIRARADWLGVVINTGQPKITDKLCSTFKAGDVGNIKVSVQNIGSGTGNFLASLSCSGITNSYNPSPFSLTPGSSNTISIPVNGGVTGNFDGACSVTIQDTNNPSAQDSTSVTCHVDPAAQCQTGSITVVGSCLNSCNNGVLKQETCCPAGKSLIKIGLPTDANYGYTCQDANIPGVNDSTPVVPGINNATSCNIKAAQQPYLGWTWVDTTSTSCGFWCSIGIGKPVTTTSGYCKASFGIYYVAGIIIIFVAIIAVVYLKLNKSKRRRK